MTVAVLVGCFVASALAQRETFQFNDSQGRCWVCHPGAPCAPCGSTSNSNPLLIPPENWDPACLAPTCTDVTTRSFLFPTTDPRDFFQCVAAGAVWQPQLMQCQCGTFFDYFNQRFAHLSIISSTVFKQIVFIVVSSLGIGVHSAEFCQFQFLKQDHVVSYCKQR